jgi:two-component system chemotaxis response regulator CheB
MNKIRVLVVDDSALMRGVLSAIINAAPDMLVVGGAPDAQAAREMIKTLNPDVLTLDVNMPGMNGLDFLERLMRLRPMPVVMVSSYTQSASETTLRALEAGAVDFIGKPRTDAGNTMEAYAEELVDKIRAARGARVRGMPLARNAVAAKPSNEGLAGRLATPLERQPGVTPKPVPLAVSAGTSGNGKIIFVGASTGGTEAIKEFLLGIPENCPPILVVQHMPESFTASFARRLDSLCAPKVIESQGNERVTPGTVYIAPGHSHLLIRRTAAGYVTELSSAEPVNRHRPSVDVLFDSAAQWVGRQAVAVILTGMGKDGAQGMLRMRQAGAKTFGQDEATCVVYGMPREAFMVGAVEEQHSLGDIARKVMSAVGR